MVIRNFAPHMRSGVAQRNVNEWAQAVLKEFKQDMLGVHTSKGMLVLIELVNKYVLLEQHWP